MIRIRLSYNQQLQALTKRGLSLMHRKRDQNKENFSQWLFIYLIKVWNSATLVSFHVSVYIRGTTTAEVEGLQY